MLWSISELWNPRKLLSKSRISFRAIAKQAEAEREKRAKIIHADGEYQASDKLTKAADVISTNPQALQLRFLGTLTEIATEKNSTIIFPLPLDILKAFTYVKPKTKEK